MTAARQLSPASPAAPLAAGDRAWLIVLEPRKREGGRRALLGAAMVRVVGVLDDVGATYRVEVLHSTGIPVGHKLDADRWELYAVNDPAARAAFGTEVRRFWGADR